MSCPAPWSALVLRAAYVECHGWTRMAEALGDGAHELDPFDWSSQT